MSRRKRIEDKVQEIGTRSSRRRRGHSENFLSMFYFYLAIYENDIATFCGVDVQVDYDPKGSDAKVGFKEYDNGIFIGTPFSCEPEILKKVIIGKKAWGLLVNEWAGGIADCLFTKHEFFEMFKISETVTIVIPPALLLDFNNRVWEERFKKEAIQKNYSKMMVDMYLRQTQPQVLSKDEIRAKVKAQYHILKSKD